MDVVEEIKHADCIAVAKCYAPEQELVELEFLKNAEGLKVKEAKKFFSKGLYNPLIKADESQNTALVMYAKGGLERVNFWVYNGKIQRPNGEEISLDEVRRLIRKANPPIKPPNPK